jgi:hypothetical protein
LFLFLRFPPPGGPCSFIYFPQGTGSPVPVNTSHRVKCLCNILKNKRQTIL